MGSGASKAWTGATWERVEDIYQIWEDMGEIDNTEPTDSDTKYILKEYDARLGLKRTMPRGKHAGPADDPYEGVMARRARADIKAWLTDRKRWSPVIDQVAVARFERAYAKEHFDALTYRERDLVTHRLPPLPPETGSLPDGWTYEEWALMRGRASRRRVYAEEQRDAA